MTSTETAAPQSRQDSGARESWDLVAVVFRKELTQWIRTPLQVAVGFISPLGLLLVAIFLFSPGGGTYQVGVVMPSSPGPHAHQLVDSLSSRDGVPMYIDVTELDAADAGAALRDNEIAAIVRIPESFDRRLDEGRPAPVDIRTFNGMEDTHKNISFAISQGVEHFYEKTVPEQIRARAEIPESGAEKISRPGLIAGGMTIYTIMFTGMLFGGLALVREWEYGTMSELAVSPSPRPLVLTGKLLAALVQVLVMATGIFVIANLLTDFRVDGSYVALGLIWVLTATLFCALGALFGALAKKFYIILPFGAIFAVVLWIICGGFGDLVALSGSFQYTLAHWLPPTYAFDGLHTIRIGGGVADVGVGLLVLAGSAIVALLAAGALSRRELDKRS